MDKTARLIGEVAARYGIRLDPDDPAFALVALNQLALEDAVSDVAARMKEIAMELENSAEQIGSRAAVAVAEQVKAARYADIAARSEVAHEPSARHSATKWLAIGMGAGLLLFGLGLVVGTGLL